MHGRWGAGLGRGWRWPREDFVTLGLPCLACRNVRPSPREGPRKVWLEKFKSPWQVVVGEIHCRELLGFKDGEFGGGGRGMCGGLCGGRNTHPRRPVTLNLIKTTWSLLTKRGFAEASFRIRPPLPAPSFCLCFPGCAESVNNSECLGFSKLVWLSAPGSRSRGRPRSRASQGSELPASRARRGSWRLLKARALAVDTRSFGVHFVENTFPR